MSYSRVFFQGLGGAGQRHLRILRDLLPKAEFIAYRRTGKTPFLNPDFSVDPDKNLSEYYNLAILDSLNDCWQRKPDLVVISTPTSSHFALTLECIKNDCHVIVEKPCITSVEQYELLRSYFNDANKRIKFLVSFQRRFHPAVKEAKELISGRYLGRIVSAHVSTSSYVPHWHPYENHSELYACRSELGGGILNTECHELDLLFYIFGLPNSAVLRMSKKSGDPGLDVPDTANIFIDYPEFVATASLCFMQKIPQRSITITGTEGCLTLDLHLNSLTVHVDGSDSKTTLFPEITNELLFARQANFFLSQFNADDNSYLDSLKNQAILLGAARTIQ